MDTPVACQSRELLAPTALSAAPEVHSGVIDSYFAGRTQGSCRGRLRLAHGGTPGRVQSTYATTPRCEKSLNPRQVHDKSCIPALFCVCIYTKWRSGGTQQPQNHHFASGGWMGPCQHQRRPLAVQTPHKTRTGDDSASGQGYQKWHGRFDLSAGGLEIGKHHALRRVYSHR